MVKISRIFAGRRLFSTDIVGTRTGDVETRTDGVETRTGGVETRTGGVETRCIASLLRIVMAAGLLTAQLHAGAWTLSKGHFWVKTAVFYQSTDSRFCTGQDAQSLAFQGVGCTSAGHSAPFDPFIGGDSDFKAVFAELAYGVTGWLDVGVQAPFYSLRFTNLADPNRNRSNSIGDIRFYGKVRLLQKPFVASIRVGAKSPTGDFTIDAEAVNVSEGQWDYEVFGEIGKSLWPFPGYVNLTVGYRFRDDNTDFDVSIGDEFNLSAEAGVNLTRKLSLKGSLDWLRGQRPKIRASSVTLDTRRELLTLGPTISYAIVSNLSLESGARFSVSGQDFPDGTQYFGGISYQFSLLK